MDTLPRKIPCALRLWFACRSRAFTDRLLPGATPWSLEAKSPQDRAQHSLSSLRTALCPAALAFSFGSGCQIELCLVDFQALLCPLVVLAQPDWC